MVVGGDEALAAGAAEALAAATADRDEAQVEETVAFGSGGKGSRPTTIGME
jgi:hypothetical protein